MLDEKKTKIKLSAPMAFIYLMGIVSLFSDMTHEGAKSIMGAYLSFMGASAAVIGFISGFGEFIGYSFRLLTGWLADKTKRYWLITIVGYAMDLFAIPFLALIPENGWIYACILIVVQRAGKALKKPAKNSLVSFAASEVGEGKSFAVLEFIDQIGAFLGPLLLFVIMLFTTDLGEYKTYVLCFASLGVTALVCLALLLYARRKYPHPETFEKDDTENSAVNKKFKLSFLLYIIAISVFAFGFVDFTLITMHTSNSGIVPTAYQPLLYSLAMLIDAFAALFFGWMFDKKGIWSLVVAVAASSTFALFIFGFNSLVLTIIGVLLWGVGMGAQESILKSQVAKISTKGSRSRCFGTFETSFGLFWFLGSWLLGSLYDISMVAFICVSVCAEIASIPLFVLSAKRAGKESSLARCDDLSHSDETSEK